MGKSKTPNDQPDDKKPAKPEWMVEAERDALVEARERLKELVHQVTVGRMLMEMTVELYQINARMKYAWFDALIKAGFSEHQSMSLIINCD